MVRGKRSSSRIAFRENSTTSPKLLEWQRPQPWLTRDFSPLCPWTNCAREARKALTVPALHFSSTSGLASHKVVSHYFFDFFFLASTKHIPCLFVALFHRSCFSALFLCGATQAFLLFSKNPSIALFAVHSELVGRKSNHRLSFACLLLERFRVLFSANGRSVEKHRGSERDNARVLKISPTSDRYTRCRIIKKNLHTFSVTARRDRSVSDVQTSFSLLQIIFGW